jgi:uncharacterized protein (TIGR04255 family)
VEERLLGLDLPPVNRVLFDRAPLVLTLAQVRYPAVIRFGEQATLAKLQDELAKDYPDARPEQQVSVTVNLSGVQQSQAGPALWRFSTLDGTWSVVVGQDAVTIEARAYEQIGHFSERVRRVLDAVEKHLNPTHQRRLGLRYVNEFRHEDGETMATWRGLLNQELLGLSGRLGENVDHSFHEIRARTEDGVLLIHHGLLRGSSNGTPELAAANEPFYLLDLDYFDETPAEWNKEEVVRRIRDWNDTMYRLFRWSMTTRLFEHLGPRNA